MQGPHQPIAPADEMIDNAKATCAATSLVAQTRLRTKWPSNLSEANAGCNSERYHLGFKMCSGYVAAFERVIPHQCIISRKAHPTGCGCENSA